MKHKLWTVLLVLSAASMAAGDELRVVKQGQAIPSYSIAALAGDPLTNASARNRASVIVYVAAEQVSSTKVMVESNQVLADLKRDDIEIQYVSADVARANWFRDFRDGTGIRGPMGMDFDRVFYGKLGVIVLPTTVVVNADGRLTNVIAGYKPDYAHRLDAYARHALGLLTGEQLERTLEAKGFSRDSAADRAARHRAAANLLREKGLHNDAESELHKALEEYPDDLDARLDLASLYLTLDRLNDARALVTEVAQREPANRRAKLLRGMLLYHEGAYADAQTTLAESLIYNTDPARTHYYLGLVYEKLGEKDKALHHYREALKRLLNERD